MRKGFLYAFLLTAIGAGGYWYHLAESKCKIPLQYDIGTVDSRFHTSSDAIRTELSEAESLWEDATGKNLFTYTQGAPFKVNFVYDDRQDTTTKEGQARQELDKKQEASKKLHAQYEQVKTEYESLKTSYAADVAAYEKKLSAYNAEVARTNAAGGASPEEFASLEKEKVALARTQTSLNATAKNMNTLVTSINTLGERGNLATQDYNQDVGIFNGMFGHTREFTQGEYQNGHINIFQFDSPVELRNVLAHELGHALSLDHVQDPKAIMYYLMDEQSATSSVVSPADIAELVRVCGK